MPDPKQEDRWRTFQQEVGEQLRLARRAQGKSLRAIRRETGIAHRTLCRIENAKTDPRLRTLFMVSEALNSPVAELVGVQPWPSLTGEDDLMLTTALPESDEAAIEKHIAESLGDWLVAAMTQEGFVQRLAEAARSALFSATITETLPIIRGERQRDAGA